MESAILVYGANGYTGRLIARLAVERKIDVVLAGRSEDKVRALADELSLPWRAFGLDDPAAVDAVLSDFGVVLNCAGPFSRTFRPMAKACLRVKAHYLDITGEIGVFERAARMGDEARKAGVMVMPGVGFDVVPTDTLAAHLKSKLPDATHLALGFLGLGGISHGTATTMVESIHLGSVVREEGAITPIKPATRSRTIDFGRGPMFAVAVPWGDVSTAWHTTGIPNIEVYMPFPRKVALGMRASGYLGWLLRAAPAQKLMKWVVDSRPAGPSDQQRARGRSYVWGEARNGQGVSVTSRLVTPEGYTLTSMTALEIAHRVVGGEFQAGFHTPASVYGADFILGLDGVERTDGAN